MSANPHIRFLQRRQIDEQAWTDCIQRSPGSLIYAQSWFLDALSNGNWGAIVHLSPPPSSPAVPSAPEPFATGPSARPADPSAPKPFATDPSARPAVPLAPAPPATGPSARPADPSEPSATGPSARPAALAMRAQSRYTAVMPLIYNRKFGFNYLYMPNFVPMLGVFHESNPNPDATPFLAAIPKNYKLWEIDLSENNKLSPGPYHITERKNFWLNLSSPGEQLKKDYRRLARRMLQRAQQQGLQVIRNAPVETVIDQFRQHYQKQMPDISKDFYKRITSASILAQKEGQTASYLAQAPNGDIQGFYLLYKDKRFVYSVLGGSTAQGKDNGAFYLLTDAAIQDHSNSPRIFRFEGSDLPGIAFFNAQFGPHPVSYHHLLLNRLPAPFRWLKPRPPAPGA